MFALAQAESERREREAERREHEALRRAEQATLSATEVSEKAKLESKALSDSMRDQEALASELARVQRLLADVRRDMDGTRAALEDTKMELHAKKCDLALAKADAEARTRALERAQLDAVQLARKTIHFADWQTAHHGVPHGAPPLHMPTPSFAAEAVCSSPSYAASYVEASSPRFSPPLTPTGLPPGPPSPRAASMAGTFRGAADPSSHSPLVLPIEPASAYHGASTSSPQVLPTLPPRLRPTGTFNNTAHARNWTPRPTSTCSA